MQVLLSLGAVTDVKNNMTQSPTDIAVEQKQDASLAVLIRKLKGSEDFYQLPWYKIINNRMHKSIYSMLDCSIKSSPTSNKGTDKVIYSINKKKCQSTQSQCRSIK